MPNPIHIGLVGDCSATITAHRAIPLALQRAASELNLQIEITWLAINGIESIAQLESYHGFWCVPGSPYTNTAGALLAIRHAREQRRPFLGTCGGFQHAVLEYARNVLHWPDAEHAESSPHSHNLVITPLTCSLIEVAAPIELLADSRMAAIYGVRQIVAEYRCGYGINPAMQFELFAGALRAVGHDAAGEIRAIELLDHPFFVATLFQPERAVLSDKSVPLASALLLACAEQVA
ncbi:MAG: hypothetical protein QM808_08215 [Steroidobacteraceae bacterium]